MSFGDKDLNNEEVDFYLKFMEEIFEKGRFKYKKVKNNQVLFELDCKNLKRATALLYLTAFRNIQEFPEFVKELFKRKAKTLEENFEIFQLIHWDYMVGKIKLKYCTGAGHILFYKYGGQSSTTISLEEFQYNVKNQTSNDVNSFFFINRNGLKQHIVKKVEQMGEKYKQVDPEKVLKNIIDKQPEKIDNEDIRNYKIVNFADKQ